MRSAKPLQTVVVRDLLIVQLFVSAALLCGQPASAAPSEADVQANAALQLAERVIETHRLLGAEKIRCFSLVYRGTEHKRIASVGVYENHVKGCGGDPDTSPRRFDLELDIKSGAAKWDYESTDATMQPVPRGIWKP